MSVSYQESDVAVTSYSQSLPYIMAEKQLALYGMKKLRHCHPIGMYFASCYWMSDLLF